MFIGFFLLVVYKREMKADKISQFQKQMERNIDLLKESPSACDLQVKFGIHRIRKLNSSVTNV